MTAAIVIFFIIIIQRGARFADMHSSLAVQAVRLLFESVWFSSIRRANPLNQVVVGKRFDWSRWAVKCNRREAKVFW